MQTTMVAGRDSAALAVGYGSVYAYPGRDAFVWTGHSSSGSLGAGRDAGVISAGGSSILLAAQRDAFAFTFDGYNGGVQANRDAGVMTWGTFQGSVQADRDGVILAFGSVVGSVDAGRYAALVTWDAAVGPANVSGSEGAYAFVYKDLSGFVESTNGPAGAIVIGTAVGAVRGHTDAVAFVAGDFLGQVDAGQFAGVITLGQFAGNVTAGTDAVLWGESDINVGATAGQDLEVWTIGDVAGGYVAGRDAWVTSYGSYDANLTTGRDVRHLWARDGISGSANAGRNIGIGQQAYYHQDPWAAAAFPYDVFSYGPINATLQAPNGAPGSGSGRIGSVGAWGPIGGVILAADSIGLVRSGDSVTANITALNPPLVIDHDATIQTQYPYPATPDSIRQEVLDDAATVYAELVAMRQQIATDIAQSYVDFADAQALEAARIAVLRTDALAQVAAALAKATTELNADRAEAAAELVGLRDMAYQMLHDARQLSAEAQARWDSITFDIHYARLHDRIRTVDGKQNAVSGLVAADAEMSTATDAVRKNSLESRTKRDQGFGDFARAVAASSTLGFRVDLTPPPSPPKPSTPDGFIEIWWENYKFGLAGGEFSEVDGWDTALAWGNWGGRAAATGSITTLAVMGGGWLLISGASLVGSAIGLSSATMSIIGGTCSTLATVATAARLPGTIVGVWNTIGNWDHLSTRARAEFVADIALTAVTAGFSGKRACFAAGASVYTYEQGNSTMLVTAAGVLVLGIYGFSLVKRRRDDENDPAKSADEVFARSVEDFRPNPSRGRRTVEAIRSNDDAPPAPDDVDSVVCGGSELSGRCVPGGSQMKHSQPIGDRQRMWTDYLETDHASGGTMVLTTESEPRPSRRAKPQFAQKTPSRRASRSRSPWMVCAVVAWLSVFGFFLYRGLTDKSLVLTPIERIPVATKVETRLPREARMADQSTGAATVEPFEEIIPQDWRLLRLYAETRWDDGTLDDIHIATLKPVALIEAERLRVGSICPVSLNLAEMGLPEDLEARIVAIEPCPPIPSGPGRVVMTTVNHLNADVHELTIRDEQGRRETIKTTGLHKFFSRSRLEWVSAEELKPNERLDGLDGPLFVVDIRPLPGVQRVYNLTVQGEHVFRVASLGVLVHNTTACGPGISAPFKTVGQIHHVISTKVARAVDGHPILKGLFRRRDSRFVTQAIDRAAHQGYQRWHRDLDDEVVQWIRNNSNKNGDDFLGFLKNLYERPDIKARFPNGF